jgi:hypothetical protein
MSHKYKTKKEAIMQAKELGCIGTHEMKDGKFMPCKSHERYLEVTKKKENPEGEIDELVDKDGTFLSSKIPILDPHVHPKKTMDQTVAMARNVYDIFRMGYRRHFYEEDMSKVFGREEDTDFMSYDETVEFLSDLLGIDDAESKSKKKEIESDAEERAKEMGKIPGKKKTQRLFEIEDEVTEDIIVKKIKTDGDINKKDKLSSKILKKNVDFVKRQAEKEGITLNELIKMLKDE